MIRWFQETAPIRKKFYWLGVVYTALTATAAATTCAAATGALSSGVAMGIALTASALVPLIAIVSRTLICDPYVNTVARMEALAAGDLKSAIAYTGHGDCVGRMTRAMEVFRRNGEALAQSTTQRQVAQALGHGLGALADKDLSHRIEQPFPAEYDALRVDYNRAAETMATAMIAVSNANNGISNGIGDIRQASDDLSKRTEQQAASLEETAAAMQAITATVRGTASGARRASSAVTEAREEAERSGDVVRRAMDAMGGIERSSEEISDIISVIDGIAFQTNLLALNAGVEAARAGDAGRGFAVVASEVRALAQRSADAAKDVKTKIMASSGHVETGVTLVSDTGKALQRIIAQIGEISTLVSTIADAAEHQSTGLQQVNTAVSEMDGVTQQNAAMVEQATAAARTLAEEASRMGAQVALFRLDATRGHAPASTVHDRQTSAANAGRQIARSTRRAVAGTRGTALAVSEEQWSNF